MDDTARLTELLDAGEYVDALHFTHTLKGTAATLGADNLAKFAANLEKLLRSSKAATAKAIDWNVIGAEIEAINRELVDIAAALPPPEALSIKGNVVKLPSKVLKTLLVGLDVLLEKNDAAAITYIESHAESLRLTLGAPYDKLESEIKKFSFEAARALLLEIMSDQID